MVLLEVLLEHNGFLVPLSLEAVSRYSLTLFQRRRSFTADLPEKVSDIDRLSEALWHQYWKGNPIDAWLGENRKHDAKKWFKNQEGHFLPVFEVSAAEVDTFTALVQELVDYRLATYVVRKGVDTPVAGISADAETRTELTYFPDLKIACGHFKTGSAESDEYRSLGSDFGKLDPARHFIARASGNSMNGGKLPIHDGDYLLLEQLNATSAGSITGNTMAIERQDAAGDNQYLLRVVTKSPTGSYILKATNADYEDVTADETLRSFARLRSVISPLTMAIGQLFMREEIPPLFGHRFNPGNWQSGHVVLNDIGVHVLLVTLNKQGKARDHRYLDYFVEPRHFHWQSQNSTSPESKKAES